ncbi:hypothetical protein [Clostridium sp. JS66]|uniref:hypothetical protein n=1 Tax=Clostridium sp. JS66 TaxID=3064705 RepID=UPI00298DF02C|nr:hypothetical protein [Clostridium sp. JS66]WPC42832.1 hypothetical protein Q6H37_05005 [Clostridium sp. JS66]
MEQYKLLNFNEKKSEEIIDKLKGLSKVDDIIEPAEKKKYEKFSSIYDNVYCTICEYRMMVEYELIIFMLEGKIMMECYRRFLRYIENLIVKNNYYKLRCL